MQDVIVKLRGGNPYEAKRTTSSKTGRSLAAALPIKSFSLTASAASEKTSQTEEVLAPRIPDANAAVALLLHEGDQDSNKQPLVVVDEFDLMRTTERAHFADFLKQLV